MGLYVFQILNIISIKKEKTLQSKKLSESSEDWGHLLDCLFRYFDGKISILEIANKHNLEFAELYDYICSFKKKNLSN